MKTFFSRFIKVPQSNNTKTVEVPKTWEVRWFSNNTYNTRQYPIVKEEMQPFYSPEEAEAFKIALKNAFQLLRYTGTATQITLTEAT